MCLSADQIAALFSAKNTLITAKAANAGVSLAKERMKNLLFNYCDDLVNTALEYGKLKEEVESLETALEESDQENAQLRKEIKNLKSQIENPSPSHSKKIDKKE